MKAMMKNLKYIASSILFALSLGSCNKYLDKLPDDQVTEEEEFTRYENVNKLVTDLYDAAKSSNEPLAWFYHFSSAAITDEAEGTTVEGSITNSFNTGDWNPNSIPGERNQYWKGLYAGIRKANIILEGIVKHNTPDNPIQPGDLDKRIGETYFLRAYLHYLVLRIYGEAPYITHATQTSDSLNFYQESVHSLVEKIVADAQVAYEKVSADTYSADDFGRVDKGACLGLIAMSRWVAATPLWNGAGQYGYTGNRIFESEYTYNSDRWTAARDAAKAVIDFKSAS